MWQYNNTLDSDELMHYGVLGMRWGVRRSPEVRVARKAHKLRKREIDNEYARARAAYETSGPLVKRRNAAYDKMVKTGRKYREENEQYKSELKEARKIAADREGVDVSVSKGKTYTANILVGAAGGAMVGLSYARQHSKSGKDMTKTIVAGVLGGAALGTISGKKQIENSKS